jgi:hypothetical protein
MIRIVRGATKTANLVDIFQKISVGYKSPHAHYSSRMSEFAHQTYVVARKVVIAFIGATFHHFAGNRIRAQEINELVCSHDQEN